MQEKKDIDLYKKDFAYNPEFWKNYNVLLLAPLDSTVKTDLTDKKGLEEQFNSNGKN
jgi:hypothetical protein